MEIIRTIRSNLFFAPWLILVIFSCVSPPIWGKTKTLGLSTSFGVPDLLNGQLSILRLRYLHFGFGAGTQPVQTLIEKYAHIDPEDLTQQISETYSVKPSIAISMKSFHSFIRFFPGTESVYLGIKYTTWNIHAAVNATLINNQTLEQFSVASVNFNIIQPMIGGGIGYFAAFEVGLFIDFSVGVMKLLKPSTSYNIGGLAGSALALSSLDEAIGQQVADAKNQIDQAIDENIRSAREVVSYIPSIHLAIGWEFL